MAINYFGSQGAGNIPVGSIVEFPYVVGDSAGVGNVWATYPPGYIPCDGRTLYKSDWPEVAELIGDSAGLPINTDGSIIGAGSQITQNSGASWNRQGPRSIRLYGGNLLVPLGRSLMFSKDKGVSWNGAGDGQLGDVYFYSQGSPTVLGNVAYIGGVSYYQNSGAMAGKYVFRVALDGSFLPSATTGTIGTGGEADTVVLGGKGSVLYVLVTSGTDSGKIYKTSDGGDNFTYTRDLSDITGTSGGISDYRTLWYISSIGSFIFNTSTGTWVISDFESGTTPTLATSLSTSSGVTFDGSNYWFTSGGKLYRTPNFVSITEIGSPLPSSFNGYVSLAEGKIFVGGDTGYYSTDNGITWNPYINDGGSAKQPFGVDTSRNLFGVINRGDDASSDLYRMKLADSSGLTFDMPNISASDGRIAVMKMRT